MMDHSAFAFICMMLSVAAAFTLDPFAPVLMFGICVRLGAMGSPALLAPPFAPFASLPFIAGAGAIYLAHAAMDKIPPVAHGLDLIGVFVKPLAIALVGVAMLHRMTPEMPVHWTIAGATLAAAVLGAAALQVARAKVRLAASAATLGVAHPFLSTLENIAALLLSWMAFTHPVAAALMVLVVIVAPLAAVVMLIGAAVGAVGRVARGRRGQVA
jgi:hypothetical protein